MKQNLVDLLQEKDEVSMMNHIAPLILNKYGYLPLSSRVYEEIESVFEAALSELRYMGICFICTPKFSGSVSGSLDVIDMIYKKVRIF